MQVIVATLDACVLFQGRLTDLLLNLAEAGAFCAGLVGRDPCGMDVNFNVKFLTPTDNICSSRYRVTREKPDVLDVWME